MLTPDVERLFTGCHSSSPLQGSAPDVDIYGDPNFTFPYVPSHLHHMVGCAGAQWGGGGAGALGRWL